SNDTETVFHSDYFWFGGGQRVFDVTLDAIAPIDITGAEIELRVHRFKTLESKRVDCASKSTLKIEKPGLFSCRIEVAADDECCYAILAKLHHGTCLFRDIDIKSYPSTLAPTQSTIAAAASLTEPIPA
ncbi:MAG: methyltransferase 11 protein, partial [Bacteroidetes bacterium]|nr:methyltransferase 11 protein [Bacteroidota bacterium]